ncbi:MAG TPA: hypothetical protein VHL79_12335, partial [Ramlibacter sp.]|nr:hypothetical protein [Ramlibacter sp.]
MSYEPWGSTLLVTGNAGAADAVVAGIGLDRFAVVWEDSAGTGGDASGTAIRLKVYDPFGVAFNAEPILVNTTATGNQANPQVLGLASGEFVVVWEDSSGTGGDASGTALKGQRFTANGEKLGVEFLVNTSTPGNQGKPALARDGTGFVVAWVDSGGANDDVRFQRFDANGVRVGTETTAGASTAGNQSQVEAADTNGGFALAWTDDADANGTLEAIRVQAYTSAGAPAAAERSIVTGDQRLVSLLDLARIDASGALGVLYADQHAAQISPRNLLRTLDATGAPIGGPFDAGWTMSGYFVQGLQLSGWQGVTGEESALARGDNDGLVNRGGLFLQAVRPDGLSEGSTVYGSTSGGSPTVLDASMLQDGRIVTVTQQGGGPLYFTVADGRGPTVSSNDFFNPVVLVGADAGPDRDNVMTGGHAGDTMYGLGGNDYLYGYAGSDLLIGGFGSDVLLGESGNDTLYG